MTSTTTEREVRIEDLYPGQTAEWYEEAADNLRRYVEVMARIYERLRAEGKVLPTPEESARMMEEDGLVVKNNRA